MEKIGIFCILFLSFSVYGEYKDEYKDDVYSEQFVSKYKDIPVQIEAANLGLRTGVSLYFISRQEYLLQFPVLVQLKMPFSLKHINTKWLVSVGGGWMWGLERVRVEPDAWCLRNSFFCDDDDVWDWKTDDRLSFFYFSLQPGLMHSFGSLVVSLRAGAFVNMLEEFGALASLSISTSDWWDIGMQTLYYDEYFYFGVALRISPPLKRWTIKNPYKD